MRAGTTKPVMLLHCLAERERGMGHLLRCRMLLEHLAAEGSAIVTCPDETCREYLASSGLPWRELSPRLAGGALGLELGSLARETGADVVVLDRKDNSRELVLAVRQRGLSVVDIEDTGPGRFEADILLDPHIQPGSREAACGGRAECCFGPGWALIDPAYTNFREEANDLEHKGPLRVTVSLGGSDPSGISGTVLHTLTKVQEKLEINLVLGPGAESTPTIRSGGREVNIHRSPRSLSPLLAASGMAIVSGGITMFESLCLGVPTVVVPQHGEQYRNASRLARIGALLVVPPPDGESSAIGLEVAVRELAGNRELQRKLAARGAELVDGRAVQRLAEKINEMLCRTENGSITADAV